ncbi:MAG: hypothetical protein QOE70_1072 [Chthoniobacter sp.]|jgi:hypothetical protein|nr:hypothetical protein [Chthoniobacter sp.]
MKHFLLLLAAVLLPSVVVAQVRQPGIPFPTIPNQPMRVIHSSQASEPLEVLPENYEVTFSISDKDTPPIEVSIVGASARFNATFGELNITLEGVITVEESGSTIVEYAFSWSTPVTGANGSVDYRQTTARGSLRLKLGEEVPIVRAGPRTVRLSIKKWDAAKGK